MSFIKRTWSEWSIDVRLQCVQVDLDDPVVLGALVGRQQLVLEFLGLLGDIAAAGGLQVVAHALVEREGRCGGTDLGAHIANGRHARARNGVNATAIVFDDGACASFDGQDVGHLQDDVLR